MSEAEHIVIAPSHDLNGNPITKKTRVVSPHGVYIHLLEPGVATKVHPSLFHPALQAGCSVPGGNQAGQVLSDEVLIEMLEEAMYSIIAEDNQENLLIKQGGKPRFNAVKALVPDTYPHDLYEAAWENVMDNLDNSRVAPPDAAAKALEDAAEAESRSTPAPVTEVKSERIRPSAIVDEDGELAAIVAKDVEAFSSLDGDDDS